MAIDTKIILVALLASPVLASHFPNQYRRETSKRYLQTSFQTSVPNCQDAGYSSCCNTPCSAQSGSVTCYCDRDCRMYGDCCHDFNDIICLPLESTCPDLTSPTNGMVTYEPSTSPRRPGTTARFRCNENYVLVGNSTRVCQQNLVWSGSSPECKETCAELPVPANGRVTYEPHTSSSRKRNRTVAIYSCNEGYIMGRHSNKNRVCVRPGESKEWSGWNVTCVAFSCQAAFPATGGCCDSSSANCHIGHLFGGLSCSCSPECFSAQSGLTCCPDIGCVPMNCSEARLSRGCCRWNEAGCYVPGGQCFCDQECNDWGDCCQDVATPIMCPSRAVSRVLTGQSVRTKPYSRVQMASRPRGEQNRKLADDQAVRELASELRSMSLQQELSNKQQRDQWEAILSELQEIQKNKN